QKRRFCKTNKKWFSPVESEVEAVHESCRGLQRFISRTQAGVGLFRWNVEFDLDLIERASIDGSFASNSAWKVSTEDQKFRFASRNRGGRQNVIDVRVCGNGEPVEIFGATPVKNIIKPEEVIAFHCDLQIQQRAGVFARYLLP